MLADDAATFANVTLMDRCAFTQAFRRAELRDQVDDSVHFFLEECDSPQGIQLMVDLADGFGGQSDNSCHTLPTGNLLEDTDGAASSTP